MTNRLLALVPLALAASLVACATGAPPQPAVSAAPMASAVPTAAATPAGSATPAPTTGSRPAATPPPAVQAEIAKALTRVARPIPDPAEGKAFKASQYWDYELGTPYEIEDTTLTGLGDADHDGRVETKVVSDVKLPNGKLQAKLMRLGKYALTQVDDEDELAEDEDDLGDDETVDEAFDFDDWEDEIDLGEVDEAIGDEEDDITWEDDWVVDADGDGAWEDAEDADYEEDYSEEEEDTFLTSPHRCEMIVHDAPGMSNQDDLVTVKDLDTGETLAITYDQDWVRFTVKTSTGQGELEYLPDGSYLVDGRPAADAEAVARAFEAKPWFRVTSRYALSLVAARLGRLHEETSRGGRSGCLDASCNAGTYFSVLEAGAAASDARRSFAIVNALVAVADAE